MDPAPRDAAFPRSLELPAGRAGAPPAPADRVRWPWLDPVLAAGFLVAFEIDALTSSRREGPLVLNIVALAALALAALWRRRAPLSCSIAVVAILTLSYYLGAPLRAGQGPTLTGAYVVLVPTYAVAVWEDRRRALLGLAILVAGAAFGTLILHHEGVGNFVGSAFAVCVVWAVGRAIRSRRRLTAELERNSARLAAEREDRARLAVAGERSRITRELHAAVAQNVAAMVIQAEAARSLLDRDRAQADIAMGAIEDTGRRTLEEMRRILGVLRDADAESTLEPQPGVDQIYTLIKRARERGQPVELSVDGEPGTLPAGVEVGVYRILEDALNAVSRQQGSDVRVGLRFGEEHLQLQLSARGDPPSEWPTDAMRERVALCGGALDADTHDEDGWRLAVWMPRGLKGALA